MTWTPVSALPVAKQWAGIAKEATKGTYVAPTAYLRLDTYTPEDKITELPVTSVSGSMATDYGMVPGIGEGNINIGGPLFADTLPWVVAGTLGDLTATGTVAPYSNAISLLNSGQGQPSSHTFTHLYGATKARAYTGCQWYEFALDFAAPALAKWTAKGFSLLSVQETAPSAPSTTTVLPTPSWALSCTIGGVSVGQLLSATVTCTRKQEAIAGLNGTQNPVELYVDTAQVSWKLTVLADASDASLDYYLNNTQPAVVLSATQGTGATETGITVQSSQVAFTAAPFKDSKGYITLDLSGTAIANTTDAGASGGESPILVTVTNAVSGGYV